MNKHTATRSSSKSNGHLAKSASKSNGHIKHQAYKGFGLDKEYRKLKSTLNAAQRGAQRKAKSFVNNSIKNIKHSSADAEARIENYIKAKPVQTLTCVALVGFVLGWMVRK